MSGPDASSAAAVGDVADLPPAGDDGSLPAIAAAPPVRSGDLTAGPVGCPTSSRTPAVDRPGPSPPDNVITLPRGGGGGRER